MPSTPSRGGRSRDNNPLTHNVAPGGLDYWYDWRDPEFGYLKNNRNAIRYPISYIYGLAAHTPTGADTQSTRNTSEIQAAALGGRIAVIYGQDRVAADIFFGPWASASQGDLYAGYGLGEGENDSLQKVELSNGTLVRSIAVHGAGAFTNPWTGFFGAGTFNFYPGVDAPAAADPLFVACTGESAATFERYPGLSFVSGKLSYNADNLSSFPDFRWTVKGLKVLDPRLGVDGSGNPNVARAWSDNPMLCLADYFVTGYYGLGVGVSGIDWASVITIANWCDAVQADGRKRFTFNSTLRRESTHQQNIDFIRSHFRCTYAMVSGKYKFYVDDTAASVKTFDQGLNCRPLRRTRIPSESIPTKVRYNWTDPGNNYQPSPAIDISAELQAGTVENRTADYNGDGCRNAGQGQSQAVYLRKKRAIDLRFSIACNRAEGLAMEMYDVVTLNIAAFGLVGQLARIVRIGKLSTGEYLFDLEKYDGTIYAESIVAPEVRPTVTLPNPSATPPAPTGLTLTQNGKDVVVTWTPAPWPYYASTRVIVTETGYPAYILGDVAAGPLVIKNVDVGILYSVAAYTVSLLGILSVAANASTTYNPIAEWPINPLITIDTSSYHPMLSLGAPVTRTRPTYGAGSWSHTGMTSFTAANVNDGNKVTLAGVVTNGDILLLDAVTPIEVAEARIWFGGLSVLLNPLIDRIYYSDDGIGYTTVIPSGSWDQGRPHLQSLVGEVVEQFGTGMGAHRYWKFRFAIDATATPLNLYEFQVFAWGATSKDVVSINIYDLASGTQLFKRSVPATGNYVASPIDLFDISALEPYGYGVYGGYRRVSVRMRGVLANGTESDPLDYYVNWAYPTAEWPTAGTGNKFLDYDATTLKPLLRFQPAQQRTRVLYNGAAWTQSGVTSFTAGAVNDTDLVTAAGTLTNADYLVVDLGSAKNLRELRATLTPIDLSLSGAFFNKISYSDTSNTGPWTDTILASATVSRQGYPSPGSLATGFVEQWDDLGAHRYWKFTVNMNPVLSIVLTELQVYEWSGVLTAYTASTNLYDMSNGTEQLVDNILPTTDTNTTPYDLTPFVKSTGVAPGGDNHWVSVRLRGVNLGGALSDPIDAYLSWTYGGSSSASSPATTYGAEPLYNKTFDPSSVGATAAVDTSTTQLATTAFVTNQAAAATPLMDGVAAVGTSKRYARADHVHPSDTTKAPLASPALTGTPTAPTAAVDTNTTQIATTAFVVAQAASATPIVDGTGAAGTSLRYARADHVHPTDTSRAPTASPTFTGVVHMPVLAPTADSTTALKITKADGTTVMITFDTTNGLIGLGGTPTNQALEIIRTGTNAAALRLKAQDTNSLIFDLYSTASGQFTGAGHALLFDASNGEQVWDGTRNMFAFPRRVMVGAGANSLGNMRSTIGGSNPQMEIRTGGVTYNVLTLITNDYNEATPVGSGMLLGFNAGTGATFGRIQCTKDGINNYADLVLCPGGGRLGIGLGDNVAPNAVTVDIKGALANRFRALTLVNGANADVALGGVTSQRITGPTAAYQISGIAAPVDGEFCILHNAVAQTLTLNHEDAGSTAANRLKLSGSANKTVAAGCSALLQYDSTDSRWRLISVSP